MIRLVDESFLCGRLRDMSYGLRYSVTALVFGIILFLGAWQLLFSMWEAISVQKAEREKLLKEEALLAKAERELASDGPLRDYHVIEERNIGTSDIIFNDLLALAERHGLSFKGIMAANEQQKHVEAMQGYEVVIKGEFGKIRSFFAEVGHLGIEIEAITMSGTTDGKVSATLATRFIKEEESSSLS